MDSIRNCKSIIHPTIRSTSGEVLDQLDWDEAVKCAEALGKRAFILEVMPHVALDLAIDRNAPKEKKGVMGVVERMGRIFGIHKVS